MTPQLILEYLKVLVWPLLTLVFVIMFLKEIKQLAFFLRSRFSVAEKLEFGFFGQEIKISGTAQKLVEERNKLLKENSKDPKTKDKIIEINNSISALSDPITDAVGFFLLDQKNNKADSIKMMYFVLKDAMGIDFKHLMERQRFALLSFYKEFNRRFDELVKVKLLMKENEQLSLTKEGRAFFSDLREKQSKVFEKLFAEIRSFESPADDKNI